MRGARAAPFHSTPVRAEAACGHRLSFWADGDAGRVGGEVAIELIVASVTFVEGTDEVGSAARLTKLQAASSDTYPSIAILPFANLSADAEQTALVSPTACS